jgi:hypothetical protein
MGKMRTSCLIAVILCALPALRAEDSISLGYGQGVPGSSNVAVAVTARHDVAIHGFSLSLAYPRDALQLLQIDSSGTSTESVGVEFFHQVLDDAAGTAVLGAIFGFAEPYSPVALAGTPSDGQPQLIAWLIFDILSGAPAGEHKIELLDGLGHPPVENRFTYQGTTIKPTLHNGSILVETEDVLSLGTPKFAFPGATINALYAYARHARPLDGFQLAVSFDHRQLELTNATIVGTAAGSVVGGRKDVFVDIKFPLPESPDRTTAGIIFSYPVPNDGKVLPPETGGTEIQTIMKYSFVVKDEAEAFGDYAALTFSDSPVPGAINNAFIADSESFVPRKIDSRIYFSTGSLRGKVLAFDDSRPLAGATLTLEPSGLSATTKADGSFLFADIPPGPFSVLAVKTDFYPSRVKVKVPGRGGELDMDSVFLFAFPPSKGGFKRGEINGDGRIDISDGIVLLGALFLGQGGIICEKAADVNDEGRLDISDAISLFNYLFSGGQAPRAPFTSCGQDPTADNLTCEQSPACNK